MKTTIEFDLPDEDEDLECALNGHEYRRVLRGIEQMCRNKVKHSNESGPVVRAYEAVRDAIYEDLEVNLYK